MSRGCESVPLHIRIHFLSSAKPAAQLIDCYGQCDIVAESCIVAIGGDGTALRALQATLPTDG